MLRILMLAGGFPFSFPRFEFHTLIKRFRFTLGREGPVRADVQYCSSSLAGTPVQIELRGIEGRKERRQDLLKSNDRMQFDSGAD